MVLARWQATIVDEAGNVLPAASVTVRSEAVGNPLALLFSDRAGAVATGNPITADSDGYVAFHVAGGAYRIEATSGTFSREWRYVAVGTAAETDVTPYLDLTEISPPASPAASTVRLYASPFDRLAYKDDAALVRYLTQDAVNVLDFGADRTGGTDSSAAVQLAIDSAGSNDIALYFPAGQYALSGSDSTLAFGDKNVVIFGDGKGVSRILCQHANAKITFFDSYNGQDDLLVKRFNMRSIAMVKDITTSSGLGGVAVTMQWSYTGVASTIDHSTFTDVAISSHTFTKFWHTSIKIIDGGCMRINGCQFYNEAINTQSGPCFEIQRAAASNITSFMISNSIIANWNTAFTFIHEAATQNGTIEGLYINNCEIFGVQIAFNDDNDSNSNHQINVVSVSNSHIDASSRLAFFGWVSGFRLIGNGINLLNTGGDPSPGGEDFCVAVLSALFWEILGNRFFRDSGIGASTCFVLPGNSNQAGILVVGNSFENFTNVSALVSGTVARTQAVGVWGPNILISSGSYGAMGIINDWENGPYKIAQDYANNLVRLSGPTEGFYFDKPVTAPVNMFTQASVNFNSANSDTAIPIKLPAGYTRYRVSNLIISGASANLSTATFGLFTAASGGGTAIMASPKAITVTTASENTNNNMQTQAADNANTQSFNDTSLFFRVVTAQGSAATGTVTINYTPVS